MRRETQNVLLILLGGAVLKIALNGQYLRYVKTSLLPWLIAAGAATVLLAAIGIVRDLRSGGAHAAVGGHDHGHSSRSPWLLLLPALAIFLIAPPALGADKVARSGDRSAVLAPAADGIGFAPLPDEEAPLLKLGDAVTRAVWDDSGTLDGRQIRLVGFLVRMPDGSVDLARLAIGCCAADAAPVKVRLQGQELDAFEPDTWLEVRGEMVPGTATEANGYVPDFTIASLEVVPAPDDPYES